MTSEPIVQPLRSTKIQDRHLERLAVVYVRQSNPQQVIDHQESRRRQYALADHAVVLGWPKDRVEELVRQLLCRQVISDERTCLPPLAPHEWWLPDLARELKMPAGKLRGWIERGWLHGRQTPAQHLWIVWADRDEIKRLRKPVARSHRGVTSQPRTLTTPKKRP